MKLFGVCAALSLTAVVHGDELVLQSGNTVQGRIVEQTSAFVRIDTISFGIRATMEFGRLEIRSVTLSALPESFFDIPARPKDVPLPRPPQRSSQSISAPVPRPPFHSAPTLTVREVIAVWQRSKNGDASAASQLATIRSDCKRLSRRTELNSLGPVADRAVEVSGILRRDSTGRLTLSPSKKSDLAVPIGPFIMPDSESEQLKPSRYATLTGYTDGAGGIAVLSCKVPEPSCHYRHQLKEHIVIGGSAQDWAVTITMTNTGKQTIKSVNLAINCFQTYGPNNGGNSRTLTFRNLEPGDVQTQEIVFNLFNYQYIGRTSMPKTDATLGSIDW